MVKMSQIVEFWRYGEPLCKVQARMKGERDEKDAGNAIEPRNADERKENGKVCRFNRRSRKTVLEIGARNFVIPIFLDFLGVWYLPL